MDPNLDRARLIIAAAERYAQRTHAQAAPPSARPLSAPSRRLTERLAMTYRKPGAPADLPAASPPPPLPEVERRTFSQAQRLARTYRRR